MTMKPEGLRFVRFPGAADMIEALQPYDDGFMNGTLGTLYDNLKLPSPPEGSGEAYYMAIYRGSDILLTLAAAPTDRAWGLGCPQTAMSDIPPAVFKEAIDLLAKSAIEITHPLAVNKLYGEKGTVDAFFHSWVDAAASKGTRLRINDPLLDTRASYATPQSVTSPPSTTPHYRIFRATGDDFAELFPMYLDFTNTGGRTQSLDVEEAHLRFVLDLGNSWLCRVDNALAGFIVLGRSTPKTIAIRHVYVAPEHRRKGIAEGLVRAINRYYLGVRPVGYEGFPEDDPPVGVKSFICLNAIDAAAENIYRRAGFLFPLRTADEEAAGGRDPITGRKAWQQSVLRGVEPEPVP
ncbi:hypothetical protein NUW54_g7570 [Trametes sanguinea]|uniref:Uncharacterized protein n=1 Tax=Trametes sanguinea TaxID=158606 RepID=A0ACC1PK37_9APHY|nr:hypothetical protein NUW54_g7570 [Trametes sanguinea]